MDFVVRSPFFLRIYWSRFAIKPRHDLRFRHIYTHYQKTCSKFVRYERGGNVSIADYGLFARVLDSGGDKFGKNAARAQIKNLSFGL